MLEVMKLKVKIVCAKDKYTEIETQLKKAGFIISDDADFVLKEVDYIQDSFIGLIDSQYEVVHYSKILYFESFNHDVFMKTLDKTYQIKEKLYEIESVLSEKGFIRINKSQIINKFAIKTLIPSFNTRINLIMKNEDLLYVTRVYSSNFKEFIGFK